LLLFAAVFFAPLVVHAQTGVLIINSTLVDNETIFGEGEHEKPQIVLAASRPQSSRRTRLPPRRSRMMRPVK
jgi:hypothetical protein